jgi:hypothetical protein
LISKKEENFQCSIEEAIKDIQQKEYSKDLLKASIQTLVKANLTTNFRLDIENHFTKSS